MSLTSKRCPKCRTRKFPEAFARDATKSSGRKSICRVCDAARQAERYAQQREAARLERLARRDDP